LNAFLDKVTHDYFTGEQPTVLALFIILNKTVV